MESAKSTGEFLKFLLLAGLLGVSPGIFSQTNILEKNREPFLAETASVQASHQPLPVLTGADRTEAWLPLIRDKRVGLVVNHSSLVGNRHLVDTLFALEQCVSRIFAPEHGFRGGAPDGEEVRDGQDVRTGTPIISLYGKKKKPGPEDFENIDVIVFDIQDVGARFYTYISTLFYVLEACAEQGVPVIVLDRPNPNGHYVDGPVLDMRLTAYVGIAPLPIVYGCTMGELARLFSGEYWIRQPQPLQLQVIACKNYTHRTPYNLPVKPSPNLPNMRSILLYPSLCLFEGTSVSVGRGTDSQFQVIGHPEFPLDSFRFVPRRNEASRYPPQEGWVCKGYSFCYMPLDTLRAERQLNLRYLFDFYRQLPDKSTFFLKNGYFDILAGTYSLRKQIEAGKTEEEIRESWKPDLEAFKEIRKKYLIYNDE